MEKLAARNYRVKRCVDGYSYPGVLYRVANGVREILILQL